jgi:hypothetical protein
LAVGAIVYAINNHEKPVANIDPVTAELSSQKVAVEQVSAPPAFVKQ